MENETKREKFLSWLIKNSTKWWLWLLVVVASAILTNSGLPILIGIGVSLYGGLAYACGINTALEALKDKEKEKKNDASY